MIIVEGPDGSGKSTLIEKLGHSRRHVRSLHGGIGGTTPEGWSGGLPPLAAYVQQILNAEHETALVAFDRFHISEVVYGPILRHRQSITEPELEMLTKYLRSKRIPVILCLPPFATTLANVVQEGRERPSYQTEGFLHQAYEGFKRQAPWATLVYDYTKDALPTV